MVGDGRTGHTHDQGAVSQRICARMLTQEIAPNVSVDGENLLLPPAAVAANACDDSRDHVSRVDRVALAAGGTGSSEFHVGTYTPPSAIGKRCGGRYRCGMTIDIVETTDAPQAIGPYSQAVVAPAGRMVFCSGQIPLDPKTGQLVGAGDVREATHQVMRNLDAVLRAAGASLTSVLKTTIYLADMADFAAVNEVYATYFSTKPPARATVQVAGLPRGAKVEIDAIAATK